MSLPLASERAVIRTLCARCVLLLLVALLSGPEFATAEDQDAEFSATVKVDATAENAAAARELARIDGQRRALILVVGRLSGSPDEVKLPKLDDHAITDMVASFEVANERMSAVRYLADYTFHFRPSKVRRFVHVAENASAAETNSKPPGDANSKPSGESNSKPAVAETPAKPIVVLPVYQDGARTVLWDDPNPWREAWGQRSSEPSGPAHWTVPLGDATDVAAIDADRAISGKSEALTAIAKRSGSGETAVALASARREGDHISGLDLSINRYRSGRLVDAQSTSIDAKSGESEDDLIKRAVTAAAELVTKKNSSPRSDQPATLAATVPLNSLGDWVQVRDRLATVPTVRKVDLLSLTRQEARIQLRYMGSADQLKSRLAEVDLDLGGGDPVWRLQRSGAANLH